MAKRVIIMGAAGRDFHDFNVVFREDPAVEVVAFGPFSRNAAPAASTSDALCITVSCETSL